MLIFVNKDFKKLLNYFTCDAVSFKHEPLPDQITAVTWMCLWCRHAHIFLLFILHVQNARVLFRQGTAALSAALRYRRRLLPAAPANQSSGLEGDGAVQRALQLSLNRNTQQKVTRVKLHSQNPAPSFLYPGTGRPALFLSIPVISYISQKAFQVAQRRSGRLFGSTSEQSEGGSLILKV